MNTNASPDGESLGTLEPGALILGGRYRVERLLGSGGMGAVYLVTHLSLGERRALKVIRPDVLRDEAALARFRREAQVQSRVRHANVVTVHDFGEADGTNVWMLLEYAEGVPLDELLAREGPMAPERAAALLTGICRGVAAAHAAGIIHRDLKPGNILVSRGPDGRESPKVLDFGIARPVLLAGSQEPADTRLTSTNMVVGTPAYLSPDQLIETRDKPLDVRSDIFTIGLIAFELLTGIVPTRSSTIAELLQRTLQPMPRLSELRPDIVWPEALEAALERATRIERAERTASALDFADEFCSAVIAADLGDAARIFPEWTPRSVPAMSGQTTRNEAAAAIKTAPQAESTPQAGTARPSRSPWLLAGGFALVAAAVALFVVRERDSANGLTTVASAATGSTIGTDAQTAGVPGALGSGAGLNGDGTADAGEQGDDGGTIPEGNERGVPPGSSGTSAPSGRRASPRATVAATPGRVAGPPASAVAAFLAQAEGTASDEAALRARVREADALLARVSSRADSVAVGYVALEAELLLERDADACRRMRWLRGRAVGSRYEPALRLMADSLPCGE